MVGKGDLITVARPVLHLSWGSRAWNGISWPVDHLLLRVPMRLQRPAYPELFLSAILPRAMASSGTALSCSSPTTSTYMPSSTSFGCWWGGCPPCVW